jgi:chorismate synthase
VGRLRFLTAGESHGPTLGVTLEGIPAGLPVSSDALAVDLARRQRGYGRGARQSIEHDRAEIVAGVRHGLTLGSPILLMVANRDWENWTRVMQVEALSEDEAGELAALVADGNKKATPVTRVRPGHADLAGALKYGFSDVRNVLERASARETAARVAAGGVARLLLRELGIEVWSFTAEVGGVAVDPARATRPRDEADESPLRCPDPDAEAAMIARIDEARSNGDTVGGVFEVVAGGAEADEGGAPVGVPLTGGGGLLAGFGGCFAVGEGLLPLLLLGQCVFLRLAGGRDERLGVLDGAEAVLLGELLGRGPLALGLLPGGERIDFGLGEGAAGGRARLGRIGGRLTTGRGCGRRSRRGAAAVVVEDGDAGEAGVRVGPAGGGDRSEAVLRGATHKYKSSQTRSRPRA